MEWLSGVSRNAGHKRLIQRLADPDQARRTQAAAELLRLGAEAVPALLEAAGGPDEALRAPATAVLVRLGPAAVPALAQALEGAHPLVRALAADLLGRIGHPSALPALTGAARGPYYTVRARAALALAAIGDRSALPALLPLLKDAEAETRGAAATAVGRFADPATFPALADLLEDPDIDVRRKTAAVLGATRHPQVVPYLMSALRDSFWWLERDQDANDLMQAIAQVGAPAAEALIEALTDPEPAVRRFAALLLAQVRDPQAVEPLGMALYDVHFDVCRAAAEALAAYGAPAEGLLRDALRHPEAWIRQQAVLGLARIGGAQVGDLLLPLLDDPERAVQMQTVQALGSLRVSAARERLEQMAADRADRELAALARQALAGL